MTQGQYPRLLEEILNRRGGKMKFSVIDAGLAKTDSDFVLDNLAANLDKYAPDMVVSMMGINDSWNYLAPGPEAASAGLLRYCRACQLAGYLWRGVKDRAAANAVYGRGTGPNTAGRFARSGLSCDVRDSPSSEKEYRAAIARDPDLQEPYIGLAKLYARKGRQPDPETIEKAGAVFRKAAEQTPGDSYVQVRLGDIYRLQGRFPQAYEAYGKAIKLDPEAVPAYLGLGKLSRQRGHFPEAGEAYGKAVMLDPGAAEAYRGLGELLYFKGDLPGAGKAYKRAVELDPDSGAVSFLLAQLYTVQGRFNEAEKQYAKAGEAASLLDPRDLYRAHIYVCSGKFTQAITILNKALKKIAPGHPERPKIFRALSSLYGMMKEDKLAAKYLKEALELETSRSYTGKAGNYLKLKAALDKRGIALVCVQYPMRSSGPLRAAFLGHEDGVVFVDNEESFRKAVGGGSYWKYFRDMFAGDFGHCTDAGNTLLAGNIADAILVRLRTGVPPRLQRFAPGRVPK